MILVRLNGGLGNQMFQYAAGLALARRLGASLQLDLTVLRGDCKRNFMLDAFGISPGGGLAQLRVRWLRRRLPVVREPHFHYWPGFESLGDGIQLQGYWQSPQYFREVEQELRSTFLPNGTQPAGLREMQEMIEEGASVAVHLRRGDYVNDPKAKAFHGSCSADYYREAISRIQAEEPHCRLFLFSDDPQWVADNFASACPYVIVSGREGMSAAGELWLMSRCRHHVIANSSFSWWAAWLGKHHGQRVFATARWFARADKDTSSLLPVDWVRL